MSKNKSSLLLLILIVCSQLTCYPQGDNFESLFAYYKHLNDNESRLVEFKDSDEQLRLKIQQLENINKSRKRFRAQPVELDILASRVANMQCREAALNDFVGHWNMIGEKPYQRYAKAGGVDHVTENAAGDMTTGSFPQNDEYIVRLMKSSHDAFMAEKRPDDGHKQAVTDKLHNYVGIGFFLTTRQFRYYEEYIDRYYIFGEVPSTLKPGERFVLDVNPGNNRYILFAIAYKEALPFPLSPEQIKSSSSYNDYSEDTAFRIAPWELSEYRSDNIYSIPLVFEKPGIYYLHLYSDLKPYRNGTQFTTEGKLQACGIVIRVE